ncbi:MAG: FAD-dependent oxidoreductase [Candidatus Eremiobacteraeota bacterium]|nr:FAD-dependent oxidoreductase [Candidatus Eremiobacteraeota bacterium]
MLTGILGGGLSGLALQRFMASESEVLEKEERPGGLMRTFHRDGFAYDIGGHILFSRKEALLEMLKGFLGSNMHYRMRANWVLYKGRYVKYPFENGLGGLDREDIFDCLMGFLKNDYPPPANFLEWIYHMFGTGIAERYLVPYNQKIWKEPLDRMGIEWVERVPRPPLEDVVKSAIGIETEGYVHQLYFYYPLQGGIEALIKAVAGESARIETGFHVREIERTRDGWRISDGSREKSYDRLVVTIPVTEALEALNGCPADVLEAARALRHNMVRIVLVGVNNDALMDKSAIYIPQSDALPHRVCFMGYFSAANVPEGKSSLIAEVTTHRNHELYKVSDGELTGKVVEGLHRAGIIDRHDVAVTEVRNIEYGYVVYDSLYREHMAKIRSYCSSLGLELLGRWGEFDYINMDEVVKRAHNLAQSLKGA